MELEIMLSSGSFKVDGLVLDANLTVSRLVIATVSNASILSDDSATVLEVRVGAPPVTLRGLLFEGGQIRVQGATVEVENCRFSNATASRRRRLTNEEEVRALNILGGEVSISDTCFEGLLGGAINVSGGILNVYSSNFTRNQAERGGALLITGGEAHVSGSNFINNKARQDDSTQDDSTQHEGGAIRVIGASLTLANKTMITGSKDQGGSVVSDVRWQYSLPAPLAHYVLDPAGRIQYPYEDDREGIAENEAGIYNYDYPAQCGATLH